MVSINKTNIPGAVFYRRKTDHDFIWRDTKDHSHDFYEIYIYISGDIWYSIDNKIYKPQHMDTFIIRPKEKHYPIVLSDRPYERIVFNFNEQIPQFFSTGSMDLMTFINDRFLGEIHYIKMSRESINDLTNYIKFIDDGIEYNYPGADVMMLTSFVNILTILNQNFISNKDKVENKDILYPNCIPDVINYINSNISNDLNLDLLSEKFHLNKSYLCQLFKDSCGLSIHNYIIQKRMNYARMLLSNGYNVAETAYKCGYNNYSYFITAFKKSIGVTPHQYKTRMSKNTNKVNRLSTVELVADNKAFYGSRT